MPVQPKPFALTTVEDLLGYMAEPPDLSGAQRDRAQRLINGYSKAALKYLRRQWKPVEDDTDKIFQYSGNGYLSLAPFEARVINTVTLHTDMPESGWFVLANQSPTQEAQWRSYPANKTEWGTCTYLTLPELGQYHPYYDEPVTTLNRRNLGYQVTINADWGVTDTDVSDDLELAVWIACANAWRNPEGYARRRSGGMEGVDYVDPPDEEGLSLPRAARALLKEYRRSTKGR